MSWMILETARLFSLSCSNSFCITAISSSDAPFQVSLRLLKFEINLEGKTVKTCLMSFAVKAQTKLPRSGFKRETTILDTDVSSEINLHSFGISNSKIEVFFIIRVKTTLFGK